MPTATKTDIANFIEKLQGIHDAQHAKEQGCAANKKTFGASSGGRKYVRIFVELPYGKSAFCFVEVATGNVLKPDGWKRPAKHARGNIFTDHGCGEFGPAYLR